MHRNRFQLYLWSLLLSGWLAVACTAPEDKQPERLIPANQMADILTEVHLAEAQISRLSLRSTDSSQMVYKHLETRFLKKFRVDTAQYRTSYVFYSSHPREMETIYQRVTKNLQEKIAAKHAPKTKRP